MNTEESFIFWQSPIGQMAIASDGNAITRASFMPADWCEALPRRESPLLREACRQLEEYFKGERKSFSVPLAPQGTSFRRRVWQVLESIGYGQTLSYAQVAQKAGNPRACRAVGGANHANPIVLFIPCHRVIAADGSLGGYGAGVNRKRFLLELEKKHS